MEKLRSASETPVSQLAFVAVSVFPVDVYQAHIGLLYRSQEPIGIRLLHLRWHHRLTDDAPSDDFIWIEPSLPKRRAKQVAARCRQILRANGKWIPYGFSLPTDNFDRRTAEFLVGPTNLGLTCATFVLAVFEFSGIRLLDYSTWKQRPDDAIWQQKIMALLERTGADAFHVEALRQTISCFRFRPEEVAAAAALFPPAATCDSACEFVVQVSHRVQKLERGRT
ncbi:MAG: hypothetical protein HY040_00980 [Planctomycetes bacterium]|nr:hypothetical protein [Planctomycetota bacterium]